MLLWYYYRYIYWFGCELKFVFVNSVIWFERAAFNCWIGLIAPFIASGQFAPASNGYLSKK